MRKNAAKVTPREPKLMTFVERSRPTDAPMLGMAFIAVGGVAGHHALALLDVRAARLRGARPRARQAFAKNHDTTADESLEARRRDPAIKGLLLVCSQPIAVLNRQAAPSGPAIASFWDRRSGAKLPKRAMIKVTQNGTERPCRWLATGR